MITQHTKNYTIRSKTGWTRVDSKGNFAKDATGRDIGWWVGYVEHKKNVYFFATRLTKPCMVGNSRFGDCRKEITKTVLKQLGAIE